MLATFFIDDSPLLHLMTGVVHATFFVRHCIVLNRMCSLFFHDSTCSKSVKKQKRADAVYYQDVSCVS